MRGLRPTPSGDARYQIILTPDCPHTRLPLTRECHPKLNGCRRRPQVAANITGRAEPTNTAGPPTSRQAPRAVPPNAASSHVDHQGNRAVARVDNDNLSVGHQKAKLTQLR